MRSSLAAAAFIFAVSACDCGNHRAADAGAGGGEAGGDGGGGQGGGAGGLGGGAGGGSPADAGTDCSPIDGGARFFGPLPYLRESDSPFPCRGAASFVLDTLEDDSLDIPGASTNGVFTYPAYGSITDSVDFDDGVIDDDCNRADAGRYCQSLFSGAGFIGISVSFVAPQDGGFGNALPTFAGLVWTDGEGSVSFEAFGADGGSLGVLGPFDPEDAGFPGPGVSRQTSEDRFFGVAHPDGISSIVLRNSSGGIEVDHPQAGR